MNDIRWNFEKWLIDVNGKFRNLNVVKARIVNEHIFEYICNLPIIVQTYRIFFAIGMPFRRYSSFTEPQNMEQDIKFLLGEVPHPSFDGNAIEYYNSRMPKDLDLFAKFISKHN